MNIKTREEISNEDVYYVIAFTRIGVLSSVAWKGIELLDRLEGFYYEPKYDMWLYPDEPIGYIINVCGEI